MAFSQDWYRTAFQSEYQKVYIHRDIRQVAIEVEFAKFALTLTSQDRILDLACGAGRHSAVFAKQGFDVCGCDYSLDLIRSAHERTPSGFANYIQWCDMRTLPYPDATFDCVVNFFTSFGYFESDDENMQVLGEIRRVIKPAGRFMLDFFNVVRVIKDLKPLTEREVEGVFIREERVFAAETKRLEKKVWLSGKGIDKTYTESVRAYTLPELSELLSRTGFRIYQTYGSFSAEPYCEAAPRLLIVAEAI